MEKTACLFQRDSRKEDIAGNCYEVVATVRTVVQTENWTANENHVTTKRADIICSLGRYIFKQHIHVQHEVIGIEAFR